jgi:cytochrome c553
MKGRVVGPKGVEVQVHLDAKRYEQGVHGVLQCTDCHVGFTGGPHQPPQGKPPQDLAELLPFAALKARVDPLALAACSRCHPAQYEELRKGVHGENIFKKKQADAPLCLDCHGSPHYIGAEEEGSPVGHARVVETCGSCHENEEIVKKYNLPPYVLDKYRESFHGKKYILGHGGVPTCATCHGSHYITRAEAPDSPVKGQGLVATCGRCHEGATAKFAAAPAHKYIGKENPIPYYGEKLLILLVFGVFGFTVSHVLLEAWAEIRDRFLRGKGGSHE